MLLSRYEKTTNQSKLVCLIEPVESSPRWSSADVEASQRTKQAFLGLGVAFGVGLFLLTRFESGDALESDSYEDQPKG